MIVMGGIVGSGIFVTPHVVARTVAAPWQIVGAWVAGGVIALAGAFVYAELAARRPALGGQYAHLRDAFHPLIAFVYGWALLLVIQTGGMAAVAVTFARYLREASGLALSEPLLAALALAFVVVANVLGVRSGSSVQNGLMVVKIVAILALVGAGLFWVAPAVPASPPAPAGSGGLGLAFLAALTPVMFSYGGWQTASFVAEEMRDPRRDLARGLVFGVLGVIALYVGVSLACVRALGAGGLASEPAPASAVMRLAFGEMGATIIAVGIAVSALGFLAQSMLTAPRVYFAMAEDGLFFRRVAWVHPGSQAPVVAIVLQGVLALVIALSGTFEQILSYVVAVDFVFFAATAATVFVFRFRPRGHPWTTGLFLVASLAIVLATVRQDPRGSAIGLVLMASGIPVYLLWRRLRPGRS